MLYVMFRWQHLTPKCHCFLRPWKSSVKTWWSKWGTTLKNLEAGKARRTERCFNWRRRCVCACACAAGRSPAYLMSAYSDKGLNSCRQPFFFFCCLPSLLNRTANVSMSCWNWRGILRSKQMFCGVKPRRWAAYSRLSNLMNRLPKAFFKLLFIIFSIHSVGLHKK